MNDNKLMNRAADNIRILAASMVEKANSGHPGGAMGGADFVNVLFSEFLVYDPENPRWEGRDRFFLDPGHMSPMLYSTLALTGKFTLDELKEFRQWGSPTPGHPEVDIMRGIENTSGPLGQGHTFAVGAAIAAKFLKARSEDFKRWYSGQVEPEYGYYFKQNRPTPEFFNIRFSFKDSLHIKPQILPTSMVNPIQMNLVFVELFARATAACSGDFIACFYIKGKSKRTDWLVKNILAKKGWFSPPFQTEKELRDILQKLYKETDIHVDGSMVYFRCVK